MKTNLRTRLPTTLVILFGLGLLLAGGNAMAADGAWKLDSGGSWSTPAGWVGNVIADGAGSKAWFTNNITVTPRTITIDGAVSSRTNGVVNLGDPDGSSAFTIAANNGASLYLSNTAGNAQINELATSKGDTISAPLVLLNSLDVNNASANTLTLSGGITAGSAGTKTISSLGSGTGTNLISAIIGDGAGTVALVQNSATTSLRLSGANTFSGGVTIKAGTVYLLTLSSAGGGSGLGTITLGNTSGSADATLLGDLNTFKNTVVVQAGSSGVLTMGNSGSSSTTFGGPVTLNTNLTLNAAGAGSINLNSNVTGIGAITATGTGSVTLSSSNDFSGGVILVAGGTLKINAANALGTGRLTLGSGTTIDNTKGSAVVNAGNNLQTWNGDFTFTGGNNLNLGTGAVTLGNNVQLTANASTLTVGGTIGDGGGGYRLTKSGAGTLLLGGSNTYTGGTTISNGTLKLGVINALLSNGTITVAGGTYDLGGFGAVTNGTVAISSGAISNGTLLSSSNLLATDSGTIFAKLAGNGGLIKTGAGTLLLSGSNTYTGGTTISNGTLKLGVQNALLSNGAVAVAGGTYDLGGFAAVTNGTVTISSGAISNGTLLSSSNLLATDSGTIFANLAGNGGLIKTGAGTLSLNGNSSQAGATQVSNGVLRVNGVLSGTAGLTVASNATLGGTGSVRGVTIADGGRLAPGNSIGTLTVSNLTLNSGSLFNFELAATNASDKVIDLGTLTLTQMPFSNFAFTTNAGFGVGSYTLIDAALLNGSFNPVTNASFYGYLGTISLDGANHDLILNVALAIPEPSALLALGGGAILLVFLHRRKA